MHRGTRAAACGVLALVVAGCGGEATVRPQMGISFQSQAILDQADLIAIYFYDQSLDCNAVRVTLPRPGSIHGPFTTMLDEASRSAGIVSRIDDISVGSYTVFVDAVGAGGQIVGSGCASGQQVFEGQISEIQIVVAAP